METKLHSNTTPDHREISQTELIIRPQTPDEEYDRVSFYLRKLPWYTENGYKLDLPSHSVFQELTQTGADLAQLDSQETREIFKKEVYDEAAYSERLRAVEADRPIIEQAFPKFEKLHTLWGFKIFPKYEIALTRFGTLGSYDEGSGKIIVSTNQKWQPKRTAIHEGVHIGIETNIVQQYRLSHWEKERVVDLICKSHFKDLLSEYTLQAKGDARIDPYITELSLRNLPSSILEYITKIPR